MATIVTASYGGYDSALHPQAEQDIDCTWLAYTDRKIEAPEPWTAIFDEPRFKDPRLAAKVRKMTPSLFPWIWIDANIEITSPGFAREALLSVSDGIALYKHPRRDCIFDEAVASLTTEAQGGKYSDQPITEQVDSYRAGGYPEHAGLYACGTIVYDSPDPRFGPRWLGECARWSIQDQLSFPVVCKRLGIRPGTFPHSQIEGHRNGYLTNRWLRIHPHSS